MIKNKLLCQFEDNCAIIKLGENLTIYIDKMKERKNEMG